MAKSLENKSRPGRPSTRIDAEDIAIVHKLLIGNRPITLNELE